MKTLERQLRCFNAERWNDEIKHGNWTKGNDMTQKTSITKLELVEPTKDLAPSTEGKWGKLLNIFNPLGAIASMYATTLAYKIETKRLEAEIVRIENQAAIAHSVIDKTYQLKMEELLQKRIALVGFYASVNAELDRLHIERMTVLEMAKCSQQHVFVSGLSLEERQMLKEMTLEILRELPRFGEQANISLQKLVQALPPVEIPPRLLSE